MKMIPKNYLYLALLLLMATLASCDYKLKMPDPGERKIVLLGELTAGDSLCFRAGQSTVVKAGATMNYDLIAGLAVQVQEEHSAPWILNGVEDDLSASEYTLSYSTAHTAGAGKQYDVTATHAAMGTATVSVTVPNAFEARVTAPEQADYNGQACLKFQISIGDLSDKQYYSIEILQQPLTVEPSFLFGGEWLRMSAHFDIYDSLVNAGNAPEERLDSFAIRMYSRVPVFTSDKASEHLLNGNASQLAKRVLLDDKNFDAATHTCTIYIPLSAVGGQFPGIAMNTLLQVKSIDAPYFTYLQYYEQYDIYEGFANTTSPTRITGNINNGVGMVGGVYKREFVYRF